MSVQSSPVLYGAVDRWRDVEWYQDVDWCPWSYRYGSLIWISTATFDEIGVGNGSRSSAALTGTGSMPRVQSVPAVP
ncbi:unnamed protein product [Caretta caretta]